MSISKALPHFLFGSIAVSWLVVLPPTRLGARLGACDHLSLIHFNSLLRHALISIHLNLLSIPFLTTILFLPTILITGLLSSSSLSQTAFRTLPGSGSPNLCDYTNVSTKTNPHSVSINQATRTSGIHYNDLYSSS